MWEAPDTTGMIRHYAHETEVAAADVVAPKRGAIQALVFQAFQRYGDMTDDTLYERVRDGVEYAPSTLRTRRSELVEAGELRAVGFRANSRGRKVILWGTSKAKR